MTQHPDHHDDRSAAAAPPHAASRGPTCQRAEGAAPVDECAIPIRTRCPGELFKGSLHHPGPWSLDGYVCDQKGSDTMIILGVILLILGFVFSIPVLWTIGLILVAVGVVLMILGATGRAVAGRRYWY